MTPEEMEKFTAPKPERRWQNLIHKKCPNCDTPFTHQGSYFVCPTPDCFSISKTKAAQYLLDPEHPANRFLSFEERVKLESMVYNPT